MENTFYTVEEVAGKLSLSERVIRKLIEDNKLGAQQFGKEYRISQLQIDEYIKDASTVHPEPSANGDTQSELDKIAAATELARKQKENLEATYELEATKLKYPDVATWRVAQEEVIKLKAQYDKDKTQLDADRDDLNKRIDEANNDIDQAHATLKQNVEDTKLKLDSALKDFDNGVRGLVEKAAQLLTTPITKAAGVVVFEKCHDCVKQDDSDRSMSFPIPLLNSGVCSDCEQSDRRIPEIICDLCPVVGIYKEASRLLLEALVASGIRPEFDTDGIYKLTLDGDKNRVLKPSERVKVILKDFGVNV